MSDAAMDPWESDANTDVIETTATEVLDSGYVEIVEITQLDRVEAKVDQLLAIALELVTWKTEIENAMEEFQSKGIMGLMSGMGGLFGK